MKGKKAEKVNRISENCGIIKLPHTCEIGILKEYRTENKRWTSNSWTISKIYKKYNPNLSKKPKYENNQENHTKVYVSKML